MSETRKAALLIVDDDPHVLRAIRHLVRGEGYSAQAFTSCAEAEAELERSKPALIISDYTLEDGDGITFLCRARELTPEAKTLLMTASTTSKQIQADARARGIHAFTEKPWDNRELLSLIADLLGAKSA